MSAPVNIANESLPDAFASGNGSVGTAEAPLTSISMPVRKHIILRANAANSGTISFGTKGNSGAGFILAAGDTSPPINLDDSAKLYLTGSDSAQLYSWMIN